jgi:hypothetical protein
LRAEQVKVPPVNVAVASENRTSGTATAGQREGLLE